MNSTAIKCLIGALLFILVGAIAYHLFPSGTSNPQLNENQKTTIASSPVAPAVKAVPQNQDESDANNNIVETATDEPEEPEPVKPKPLRYLAFQTQDGTGDQLACLEFNGSFENTKESDVKPFLRVTPETPFSIDARGNRICLLGLNSGRSYNIQILKDLTADNKSVLPNDVSLTATFEDKPAFVGFAGDGIILPDTKGARVVLKTVNVDKLSMQLYRVNDRILSQHSPDIGEGGTADQYIRTYEASSRRTKVWSGELDIALNKNEIVETPFDLQDKIEEEGLGR